MSQIWTKWVCVCVWIQMSLLVFGFFALSWRWWLWIVELLFTWPSDDQNLLSVYFNVLYVNDFISQWKNRVKRCQKLSKTPILGTAFQQNPMNSRGPKTNSGGRWEGSGKSMPLPSWGPVTPTSPATIFWGWGWAMVWPLFGALHSTAHIYCLWDVPGVAVPTWESVMTSP